MHFTKSSFCTAQQRSAIQPARVPYGYWNVGSNQRKFMDELARKLNFTQLEDWRTVTAPLIRQHGGGTLLMKYRGSTLKLLQFTYPEHNWEVGNRYHVPKGFWHDVSNQRKFMDDLGKKLNVEKLQDWNNFTKQQFLDNGGGKLLFIYNGSFQKLLRSIYPEHSWQITDRAYGRWKDTSNHRKFMDELGKKLNIKRIQDWNLIKQKQIVENGGGTILCMHNGSVMKLLQTVYPEHTWNAMDRGRVTSGFWRDTANHRKFMDLLGQKLNITKWQDWEMVSWKQLAGNKASYLKSLYKSKRNLIHQVYSEHDWKSVASYSWKSQWHLQNLLQKIIPQHKCEFNSKHHDLYYENLNQKVEFDIYFPSLSLAVEYQGETHYFNTFHFSVSTRQQRVDRFKKSICPLQGITLITVPFWWNGDEESLVATLQKIRPDIELGTKSTSGKAITEDIPLKIQEQIERRKLRSTPKYV